MRNADKSLKDKKNKLAANLRGLRIESDHTQRNIAKVLGVNRSTYAYYELGKTLPNVFTLFALCGFYGITVSELLHMDEGIVRANGQK